MNRSAEFAGLMEREQSALEQLYGVLQREQQAVKLRQIESMREILAHKLDLLERLTELDGERKSLLKQAGYSLDQEGFKAFLAQSSPSLVQQWQAVEARLQQCHHQHQINTKLLELSHHHVRQLLQLLVGDRSSSAVNIYDKWGATAPRLTTHTSLKV